MTTFDANSLDAEQVMSRIGVPAIILGNVATCCACVLASTAFIFLGVLQSTMIYDLQ